MILELASLVRHQAKITTVGGDARVEGNTTATTAPQAELVQPLFVDAEMVADLVDHGDGDLARDLVLDRRTGPGSAAGRS